MRVGELEQRRPRRSEHGQRRVVLVGCLHDRSGLIWVAGTGVVQRSVRFHVGDPGAGHLGEPVERSELVQHGVAELARIDVDESATEADQVGVRHVTADRDVAVGGGLTHTTQRRRVAGMEPARDVGTGDQVEHRLVVAQRPGAERFTQVGVQVDRCHGPSVDLRRSATSA